MLQSVRVLPVVVSAVVVFLIGMLWYSPVLFAKAWMKAHGHTEEKLRQMQAQAGRAYAVTFVCYLVMAFAMSVLLHRIGVVSVLTGIKVGAILGLGFAAPLGLTANVFSEKPLSAYLIDAAYQVVFLIVMGAILAAWR
jgi:uncharacterized protein YneF (UPF0154 family)